MKQNKKKIIRNTLWHYAMCSSMAYYISPGVVITIRIADWDDKNIVVSENSLRFGGSIVNQLSTLLNNNKIRE